MREQHTSHQHPNRYPSLCTVYSYPLHLSLLPSKVRLTLVYSLLSPQIINILRGGSYNVPVEVFVSEVA